MCSILSYVDMVPHIDLWFYNMLYVSYRHVESCCAVWFWLSIYRFMMLNIVSYIVDISFILRNIVSYLDIWSLMHNRSSLIYKTSARHKRHECQRSDCNPNAIWATRVRREQHECNTSAARVLHEWHEYNMSATRKTRVRNEYKILILITTWAKTYFHTPIFTIWQVKDYKKRNNFILRTTFWKCLVPMPKCVWKMHHKNWTF